MKLYHLYGYFSTKPRVGRECFEDDFPSRLLKFLDTLRRVLYTYYPRLKGLISLLLIVKLQCVRQESLMRGKDLPWKGRIDLGQTDIQS